MKSILTFLSLVLISSTVFAEEYFPQCHAPAEAIATRFSEGIGNAEISPVRFVGRYFTNVEQWELVITSKKDQNSSTGNAFGTYKFDCRTRYERACICEWVSFNR